MIALSVLRLVEIYFHINSYVSLELNFMDFTSELVTLEVFVILISQCNRWIGKSDRMLIR